MKWILLIIAIGLVSYGSIEPVEKIIYIEKTYAHENVRNLDYLYKHIINPLMEQGEIYIVRTKGGYPNSQHYYNKAGDSDDCCGATLSNRFVFYFIYYNCPFDQLIWEFGNDNQPAHVHFSYDHGKNRYEVLKAYKDKRGITRYKEFNPVL